MKITEKLEVEVRRWEQQDGCFTACVWGYEQNSFGFIQKLFTSILSRTRCAHLLVSAARSNKRKSAAVVCSGTDSPHIMSHQVLPFTFKAQTFYFYISDKNFRTFTDICFCADFMLVWSKLRNKTHYVQNKSSSLCSVEKPRIRTRTRLTGLSFVRLTQTFPLQENWNHGHGVGCIWQQVSEDRAGGPPWNLLLRTKKQNQRSAETDRTQKDPTEPNKTQQTPTRPKRTQQDPKEPNKTLIFDSWTF